MIKNKSHFNIDGLTLTEARAKKRMYIAIRAFKKGSDRRKLKNNLQ